MYREAKGLINFVINGLDSRFNNEKVLDVDCAQKVLLHNEFFHYLFLNSGLISATDGGARIFQPPNATA